MDRANYRNESDNNSEQVGQILLADCNFDRPDYRLSALKQSGGRLAEGETVFDTRGLYDLAATYTGNRDYRTNHQINQSNTCGDRELLEREAARNLVTFQENQKSHEYFRANQRLNERASTALYHGNLQEFEQVFASPEVTKEMRAEYLARGGAEAIRETFGTSFNSDTQAVHEALDYVRNGK
ncbi:MAG: hypothetical protein EKK48_18160 [Candidatus Melainabacteria bacterium]|nr:MAG: hypothetical protein EKK48_18160 [Candidatus Melainabacteria bacterium]